jgi:hypothetical protein
MDYMLFMNSKVLFRQVSHLSAGLPATAPCPEMLLPSWLDTTELTTECHHHDARLCLSLITSIAGTCFIAPGLPFLVKVLFALWLMLKSVAVTWHPPRI